jgi:hypothetical protein
MKTVDFGAYIVAYNFVIGVLLMLSSDKLGAYAGHLSRSHAGAFTRYTRVGIFTFGAVVAALSGTMYLVFHVFRIGL